MYKIDSSNSVPALLPPKRRSGIYVLHVDTRRYYVGQSVDAYRRYLEHGHIYLNITAVSLKPIKKDKIELDAWEYNVIQELGAQGFSLLNAEHCPCQHLLPLLRLRHNHATCGAGALGE